MPFLPSLSLAISPNWQTSRWLLKGTFTWLVCSLSPDIAYFIFMQIHVVQAAFQYCSHVHPAMFTASASVQIQRLKPVNVTARHIVS